MNKFIIKSYKYALLMLSFLYLSPAQSAAEHDLQSPFSLAEKTQSQTVIKLASGRFHYLSHALKVEPAGEPTEENNPEIAQSITEFAQKNNYSNQEDLILNWMLTRNPNTRINLWSSFFGFTLLSDSRIEWGTTDIPVTSMSLADYMKILHNKHEQTQSPDRDYETIISGLKPLDEQSKLTKLEEKPRRFLHGWTRTRETVRIPETEEETKEWSSIEEQLKDLDPECPAARKLIERRTQLFECFMHKPVQITTRKFYPQSEPRLFYNEKYYPANEIKRGYFISQQGLVFTTTDALWVKKLTNVGELSKKDADEADSLFSKELEMGDTKKYFEHIVASIQQNNSHSAVTQANDEYHIITKTPLTNLLVDDSSK